MRSAIFADGRGYERVQRTAEINRPSGDMACDPFSTFPGRARKVHAFSVLLRPPTAPHGSSRCTTVASAFTRGLFGTTSPAGGSAIRKRKSAGPSRTAWMVSLRIFQRRELQRGKKSRRRFGTQASSLCDRQASLPAVATTARRIYTCRLEACVPMPSLDNPMPPSGFSSCNAHARLVRAGFPRWRMDFRAMTRRRDRARDTPPG